MGTPARSTRNGKKTALAGLRGKPAAREAERLAKALADYRASLEQQAATAEILRIIASSPESTDAVFEAITRAGTQLLPGTRFALFLVRDGQQHFIAHSGIGEGRTRIAALFPRPVDPTHVGGATILGKKPIHIPDIRDRKAQRYKVTAQIAQQTGFRAVLGVPLLRGDQAIGALTIGRGEPGPFTARQIALAKTFADQAVIAIENARLFNETKEALEQQTATGDILASISGSMTD